MNTALVFKECVPIYRSNMAGSTNANMPSVRSGAAINPVECSHYSSDYRVYWLCVCISFMSLGGGGE